MARHVETILIDDLDGTTATETLTFSLGGSHYEIDLNEANAATLRAELGRYVSAGRTVKGARRAYGSGPQRTTNSKSKQIRAWAEANGQRINSRGRINADVVSAYEAAHQN